MSRTVIGLSPGPAFERERDPTGVEARIDSQELVGQPVKAGAIGSSPTVVVESIANVVVLAGTVVVLVLDVGTVVVLVGGKVVVLVVLVVLVDVVEDVGGEYAGNSNAPISTLLPETRTYGVPR
jgi:hypothetical protein